jgi:hypothetical protein
VSERGFSSTIEAALESSEFNGALLASLDLGVEITEPVDVPPDAPGNAGFELNILGTVASGWSASGSTGNRTISSAAPITGTYSLRLGEGASPGRVDSFPPHADVFPGETYRATISVRRDAAALPTGACRLRLRSQDAAGAFVAFSSSAQSNPATSGVQTLQVTYTLPASTAAMTLVMDAVSTTGSGGWYVDDVVLERAHTVTRVWSGVGKLSWNGFVWYGMGKFANIDKFVDSADDADIGIELRLNYLDDELRNAANLNDWVGGAAAVYLAVVDPATRTVSDAYELFPGYIDEVVIEDAGETGSIIVRLASELSLLRRSTYYALSNAHQQALFPGDVGLEFASRMDEPLLWGRKPTFVLQPGTPIVPPSSPPPYPGYEDQFTFPLPGST